VLALSEANRHHREGNSNRSTRSLDRSRTVLSPDLIPAPWMAAHGYIDSANRNTRPRAEKGMTCSASSDLAGAFAAIQPDNAERAAETLYRAYTVHRTILKLRCCWQKRTSPPRISPARRSLANLVENRSDGPARVTLMAAIERAKRVGHSRQRLAGTGTDGVAAAPMDL